MERDEGDIDDVYNILESYALQVEYYYVYTHLFHIILYRMLLVTLVI